VKLGWGNQVFFGGITKNENWKVYSNWKNITYYKWGTKRFGHTPPHAPWKFKEHFLSRISIVLFYILSHKKIQFEPTNELSW